MEGLAIAERNVVPDLNVAAVQQCLVGDGVGSWMRLLGEALRDYPRSCDTAPVWPSDGMGNAMECLGGDRMAYWLWGIIAESQHACT